MTSKLRIVVDARDRESCRPR